MNSIIQRIKNFYKIATNINTAEFGSVIDSQEYNRAKKIKVVIDGKSCNLAELCEQYLISPISLIRIYNESKRFNDNSLQEFINKRKELYNKAKNIQYTFNNETLTLPQFAVIIGMDLEVIYNDYLNDFNNDTFTLDKLIAEHLKTGSRLTSGMDLITIFLNTENEQTKQLREWVNDLKLDDISAARRYRHDILHGTNTLIPYIEKQYKYKQQGLSYRKDNTPNFTFDNRTQTLREWAEELQCNEKNLMQIYKRDKSPYIIVTEYLKKKKQRIEEGKGKLQPQMYVSNTLLEVDGEEKTLVHWCKENPRIKLVTLRNLYKEDPQLAAEYVHNHIQKQLNYKNLIFTIKGQTKTLEEWINALPNIDINKIDKCLANRKIRTIKMHIINCLQHKSARTNAILVTVNGITKSIRQWMLDVPTVNENSIVSALKRGGEDAVRKYITNKVNEYISKA